ncbi:MAG: hypothetical protein K2G08_01310 [Paramuribaculum sp.]|nr:hypothetical protein [Paramuribaculum sp.]
MKYNNDYADDPFFKYTEEERRKITQEEYCALIEEHNKYARKKYKQSQLNEEVPPKFNTVEELLEYYDAIPFEEAVNKLNELFKRNE